MPYTYTYGSGTENDPYQVWDADDLNGLIDYDGAVGIGVYFKQMDNIDMEGITYNLPGISSDWQANYDGNNKYIYSLNKPFMGYTWESTISDLILIGDIVDYTDLFAFGGFICGPYGGSHIKRCGFIGDIKWPSRGAGEWAIEVIGGFASEMSWGGGTIERCFAVGTLDFGLQNIGNTYGGFISYATDGGGGQPNISNCFARFNIVGSGDAYDGENVGGFIGFTNNVVNITHCYTASSINISEENNQGCFVGDIRGTGLNITNCYYDSDLCSLGDDSDAESRTTNQMIYPYTDKHLEGTYVDWGFEEKHITDLTGYDFVFGVPWLHDYDASVNSGYPILFRPEILFAVYSKIAAAWKSGPAWIKKDGTWKSVTQGWIKEGGAWKPIIP